MKKTLSAGEVLLYNRVQQQLDEKELVSKDSWKHPKGSFFRKLKGIYYITAVYSFLVFLLNELVFFMLYGTGFSMTQEQIDFFSKNHWVVHGSFLLALVAFVFMCMKKIKIACGCQLIVGFLMIFQTVQIFTGLYANQGLLGGLYIGALVPFLCAVGMIAISKAYVRRVKLAVEKEIQTLYNQYDNEDGLMSAKEWDSILEQHELQLKD